MKFNVQISWTDDRGQHYTKNFPVEAESNFTAIVKATLICVKEYGLTEVAVTHCTVQ